MNPADAFAIDMSELEPISGPPDQSLRRVFELIKKGETQEQWAEKCEALVLVRRIAITCPEFLLTDLHVLLLALVAEVGVEVWVLVDVSTRM